MNESRIDQFKHEMNERHDLIAQRNRVYTAMNDFATAQTKSFEELNPLLISLIHEMETFINIKLEQIKK